MAENRSGFAPHQWNYEEAGVDWRERAMMAAHVAGKNAIRAQDAEAEIARLRGVLSQVAHDIGEEGSARWSREVYDQIIQDSEGA
jgi:hypothetical protein